MAIVIAIHIRKGGTGKTALTYNLAAMLAHEGYKVLVIDLDGQGSLTKRYGVEKNMSKKSIGQMMMQQLANAEICYADYILKIDDHIDLISGNNSIDAVNNLLSDANEPLYVLADAIEGLKPMYDYIIIDNAPALNRIITNSFVAADQVLLCVKPVAESIGNINDSLDQYKIASKRANPNLKINGILFNLANERTNNCLYWENEIVNAFPNIPVYDTAIPISVKVDEGNDVHKPIVDYMEDNSVAKAYQSFFREFMENPGVKL